MIAKKQLTKERRSDILFIKKYMEFVPFTRLVNFVEYLPNSVKLTLNDVVEMFENLHKDNPHLYPFNDSELQKNFDFF